MVRLKRRADAEDHSWVVAAVDSDSASERTAGKLGRHSHTTRFLRPYKRRKLAQMLQSASGPNGPTAPVLWVDTTTLGSIQDNPVDVRVPSGVPRVYSESIFSLALPHKFLFEIASTRFMHSTQYGISARNNSVFAPHSMQLAVGFSVGSLL